MKLNTKMRPQSRAKHWIHPYIVAGWLLVFAGVTHAATLTVNSLADNTTAGNGLVTLREAIIAAENNSTTDLGQTGTGIDTLRMTGLSGTINLTGVMPSINSTINFSGPGAETLSIDGNGLHNFLVLGASADVSIEGLSIVNCFRNERGGAIFNQGKLSLNECILSGNRIVRNSQFDTMGSAVYGATAGSVMKFTDCVFRDNIGECNPAGAIFFIGSAMGTLGSADLTGCLFERNSTLMSGTPSGGGGMGNSIGMYGVSASVSLENCVIRDGYFTQSGPSLSSWGAIYIGFESAFSAHGCTWTGNTGYPVACLYQISNAATSGTLELTNCTLAENGDRDSGSMIYVLSGSKVEVTLDQCTIVDNLNRGDLPLSVFTAGGSPSSKLMLINSVLANADKSANRAELQSGTSFFSNGFNFIANTGGATSAQPVMTYANTAAVAIRQLVDRLADNGGLTETCALPTGSLLIDTANPSGFASMDQRGVNRPRDGNGVGGSQPDLGAYERFNGDLTVTKTVDRAQAGQAATLVYTLTVTNSHPSEVATGIVVTDTLPSNVLFQSFSGSSFTSVSHDSGLITAKRTALAIGASAQVTVTCLVQPYDMVNTLTASQLGFELNPANNQASASTLLVTPVAPRILSFAPTPDQPTSQTQVIFRATFDRIVTGFSEADLAFAQNSLTGAIASVTPLGGGDIYDVTVNGIANSGFMQLILTDDDSVRSIDGEALGGFANDGATTSTRLIVDLEAPQSNPIAAAGTLGPPATTVFHLLFTAEDNLTNVRGVEVYYRKGSSGTFTLLPGGPIKQGYAAIDTALLGGNGVYEFYTIATDNAGNRESKAAAPEIGVTFGATPPQSGVLSWELY